MRENNLLSPHRCRRRGGNPHDGEIITHAPNLMWGTDGVRVFTVDGRVWSSEALCEVVRSGRPNGVTANRDTRRNHAIDVTCHITNCIESSSGMITEANAVNL